MYVQKIFEKKTGKTVLYFATGTRINGKNKTIFNERIGYLEDLQSEYPDPIAHFREIARQRTKESKESEFDLHYSTAELFSFAQSFDKSRGTGLDSSSLVRSYGVLPLMWVYRDLELDYFLNIRRQYRRVGYNLNHIFQMLVFGRILSPDSKLGTWRDRSRLLFNADFSDDDVYRSLEFFASVKTDMIRHLNDQMVAKYRRRTTLMYYDVTNYYWEIDEDDDLRRRGCSKEHRPEPIVQMGLFMDDEGLPVTYGLFPGNTNDVVTMRPMMDRLLDGLGNRDYIYVADRGIMSGMNIAQIVLDNKGYVISDSVRKASRAMKDYVLDRDGYTRSGDGSFMYKSRLQPRDIRVETMDGRQRLVRINERQIVFWSEKYSTKQGHERERAVGKALDRTSASGEGSVLNNHAGNRYIKKVIFDSTTGREVSEPGFSTSIDQDLIASEEELDGYYIIRTNVVGIGEDSRVEDFNGFGSRWHPADNLLELDRPLSDLDVIDIYRGLWQIEDSFRITKSILRARPVFVRNEPSIEAHFLSCFVALLILRLLEKKTGSRIPVRTIVESLRKADLAELPNGTYMNTYCDNVISDIGKALDLQMDRRFYSKRDVMTERGKTVKKF